MLESLLTISVVGLLAGCIFSMPVAGPISIFITSQSLKGDHRRSVFAATGASIIDLIYCFIAVYSFTRLYELYQPIIHYVFLIGSVFLFIVGTQIIRTDLKLSEIEKKDLKRTVPNNTGRGFWTGFMLNLINPSLFIGWLMSSFLIMSYVSSLGFNTGGLETILNNNIKAMNHIETKQQAISGRPALPILKSTRPGTVPPEAVNTEEQDGLFSVLLSLCYAVFVAAGTIIWFTVFSRLIVKYRLKMKLTTINNIIRTLGVLLCFFAFYLGFKALNVLLI